MYEAIPVKEVGPGAFVMDRDTPVDPIAAAIPVLEQWPVRDKKIQMAETKADLGLIPMTSLYGAARVFAYGAKKYAPGNFYEANVSDDAGRRYISAALRHLAAMQLPNGLHVKDSLTACDLESGLPHIDHAICGLLMLRQILTKNGILPVDPKES